MSGIIPRPWCLLLLAVLSLPLSAATISEGWVIQATATVQVSPPTITLSWPALTIPIPAGTISIYRKPLSGAAWVLVTTVSGSSVSYIDSGVTSGTGYEYYLQGTANGVNSGAAGYLYAGIDLPVVDNRGRVVLVIDSTMTTPLASELDRLELDLIGDGWAVERVPVTRQATLAQPASAAEVAAVKLAIDASYNANPTSVKAVLLFGRVPVPYAGDIFPDGHGDHQGAWPADVYYASVNQTWTDSFTNHISGMPRNSNVPGDGRFDESSFTPSDVAVAVGRVDMSALGSFAGISETELLRRYLNKDHDFRHKNRSFQRRCIIDDNFTGYSEGFAQSGWRIASLVGTANVVNEDFFGSSTDGLWSYGCGGGSFTSVSGVGSTSDFVANSPRSVFTMLFGSYNGDYDSSDNFMRACLASSGAGLTCVWAGRPNWFFHHMAMGEPIATSIKECQSKSGLYNPSGFGPTSVHRGFLGDPTLRMHIIAPPTSLTVAGGVLTWNSSTDAGQPGFSGYHTYRAPSASGTFVRQTLTPVTGSTWTDPAPPGTAVYQVRAVLREGTPGGTYFNTSQSAQAAGGGPPGNTVPVVNAGPDLAITLPAAATLDGTVSDDGLPSGTVTQVWTVDSGPGTVTFAGATAVDTTATFSLAGTYVLRLTATDSALSAFDTVTVTVTLVPPVNTAPVVSAGPDLTATQFAFATLVGSVSDDGLPSGTVTQLWTVDSGPGTVTFGNAFAAATTARFSLIGTYVLRLTATDTALTTSDTTTVTVVAGTIQINNQKDCGFGAGFALFLGVMSCGLLRSRSRQYGARKS